MTYQQYITKRKIEDILLLPFIFIGRLIAWLRPLNKQYETFFFFPFYHTGGAEKVHALIAQATGSDQCIIYFTRRSHDDNFYEAFIKTGCTIKDISRYTDNKWLYFLNFIYRGIISAHINRQQVKPVVFNGQCNFGYKLSPWMNSTIPQVELIHSFNTFSWIRLPFLPFITKTIMISRQRIDDHLEQYKKLKVPAGYNQKIEWIVNGIPLPAQQVLKDYSNQITVLYVGRATSEKRVHLVAKIAEQAALQNLVARFVFMGEVSDAIPKQLLPYCILTGPKNDPAEINEIYNQAHIVIITSTTEGFPLVIEEGMASGCAVIATPVGDISYHIKDNVNGFLFTSIIDEAEVVNEGVQYIAMLCNNRQLLQHMAANNVDYANKHFSLETFANHYRQLFNQLRTS